MKAQDVKAGHKHVERASGKIVGGWKATGDAVVDGGMVYIPVKYFDGLESAITRIYNAEVEVE